jgi:catechol 2,3-dioxygenase-like lactoylglutathione lyase family enzyme
LPVSDVERALRFYVDQVGFTLDVEYRRLQHRGGSRQFVILQETAAKRPGTRRHRRKARRDP